MLRIARNRLALAALTIPIPMRGGQDLATRGEVGRANIVNCDVPPYRTSILRPWQSITWQPHGFDRHEENST
jgi:hypothetical protein